MKQHFFAFLFLLSVVPAFAAHVAVLETVADPSAKDKVKLSDRQYLTNVLREEAVKQLPAEQNFTIMTRENILQMLPPGKAIEDCEGECLVETGKNISADYICQARVGSFGGSLTLSAELYETAGNKLVSSFNGQGKNVNALLDIIKKKAPDFFRSAKSKSTGFDGLGGIGSVGSIGDYSYSGKKKFIVEITSEPKGAVPTIDGRADSKCLSTPCKVQVEAGSHRIVVSKDRYDDGEIVVDVKENNQKVSFSLTPAFGWLVVKPEFEGNAESRGKLSISVDGNHKKDEKIELDPGVHKVSLSHPCYDPVEFVVSIAKNKTELFDRMMTRGKGGLELNAEFKGEPQSVTVRIDGVEAGSTPYAGEVPMCAEVELVGSGWAEKVDVQPKWHKDVQVTHSLAHSPDGLDVDETRLRAKEAYAELDGDDDFLAESGRPSKVKNDGSGAAGKILLGTGVTAAVTGVVLAVIGNSQAKSASEKKYETESEFKKNRKDAESGQTLRSVGIGIAIVGAIGIGISFAF